MQINQRTDEPTFTRFADTPRSQIAQDINDHCIKIKIRFSGIYKGKSAKRYWSFDRKDKAFGGIIAPVKLLLRSETPVSSMIPDFGAGGYWIDFYISPDMAYRTQFEGDRFMIHEKSTDNTQYVGGKEDAATHREPIGLLIEQCPKWFTDKEYKELGALWKEPVKDESSH
ncbi:hypothetical protein [uncultured Desulfobulbus sp.]|uniref:hypothetical protein n=1 Tax=uncultured Desulfobulbus sp. TaxID=239745 RepID=UPI0029C6499D|nr:hypothetical protein [uncultured Desulfobulbus sp.]